jgi:hypothetical protein
MTKKFSKIFPAFMALGLMSACAQGGGSTWYEERCVGMGMAKGSADFEQCVARDKKWIQDTHANAARQNHP